MDDWPEVSMTNKITMVLMGGEWDGETRELDHADIPQIFYAVPLAELDRIKATKDNDAKRELRDKLAVLAYKYDPVGSLPDCFRMVRTPELDKVAAE